MNATEQPVDMGISEDELMRRALIAQNGNGMLEGGGTGKALSFVSAPTRIDIIESADIDVAVYPDDDLKCTIVTLHHDSPVYLTLIETLASVMVVNGKHEVGEKLVAHVREVERIEIVG